MLTFKDIRNEQNKKDGLKIIRQYLDEFHKQVLAPMPDYKNKEQLLIDTVFLAEITDEVLEHLSDYYDTVREEAQLLLLSIAQRFLPQQIGLD